MSLFVDTSVWHAAADMSDAGSSRAKATLAGGEPLATTDHVLVETWTLIRYRNRAARRRTLLARAARWCGDCGTSRGG